MRRGKKWRGLIAPPAPFRISPFGPTGTAWLLISNQPRAALSASLNNFRWTALTILSLPTLAAMGMGYRFKLGKGQLERLGEATFKDEFRFMSFKPWDVA